MRACLVEFVSRWLNQGSLSELSASYESPVWIRVAVGHYRTGSFCQVSLPQYNYDHTDLSRAMHRQLLLTSQHHLAESSLRRIRSFLLLEKDSSTLIDAQKRTVEADMESRHGSAALRDAFIDLWARAEGVDKGSGGVVWEDVRERLRRLEETASRVPPAPPTQPAPPSQPATPRPALKPSATKDNDVPMDTEPSSPPKDGKRGRARELLEDVIARLESVEGMREGFEERLEEFENYLYLTAGEAMDRMRGWGDLERERDPTGRLRGMLAERPGREEEQEKMDGVEKPGGERQGGPDDGMRGTSPGQLEASTSEIKVMRDELAELKAEMAGLREEKEKNNREVIVAVMEGMRAEYSSIVRKVCPAAPSVLRVKRLILVD